MNNFFCKYLTFTLLLALFSCGETSKPNVQPTTQPDMKKSMEVANRYIVKDEEQDIENYIKRHGIAMEATGTGLRYAILKRGDSQLIAKGDKVSLEYELKSIMGDVIYTSENDGIKSFVVGDGSVEAGLDEVVRHLHRGDLAKVIIPSHLAYGLHGDDRSIPEYATLVYTIKIIDNQ